MAKTTTTPSPDDPQETRQKEPTNPPAAGNHPTGRSGSPSAARGRERPGASAAPDAGAGPRPIGPRPPASDLRPVAAPRTDPATRPRPPAGRFARRPGRDYARVNPNRAPEPVNPNRAPEPRSNDAPATVGDLKALRTEVRQDTRDLRNAMDAHAKRAEERTVASEQRATDAIKDSEQRTMEAIRDSEKRTMAAIAEVNERVAASEKRTMEAIRDSEQRTMAAIAEVNQHAAAAEKRLVDAIAEIVRQFEARDTTTNERITRGEARQRWWNRVYLVPYVVALGEILRRFVGRLF